MYICVCNAVTERQVRTAIEQGASTIKHLREALDIGKDCGSCVACAKACIKDAKEKAMTQEAYQDGSKPKLVRVA